MNRASGFVGARGGCGSRGNRRLGGQSGPVLSGDFRRSHSPATNGIGKKRIELRKGDGRRFPANSQTAGSITQIQLHKEPDTSIRNVPVVTQIQGVTFYRTSMTISNGNPTITTPVEMLFSYRSPADGSFQLTTLTLSPLGPHQVRFFDDIVQEFKNAGRIRAADVSLGLFGTLLVAFPALDIRREAEVVARTYSAAPGGGTLGFSYQALCFDCAGSQFPIFGAGRSGSVFGNDGSTRANLGIINQGFGPTDVLITYYNGDTGAQLKQFLVSSAAGHLLEENEVYQLNNIFNDAAIPATVHSLEIRVETPGEPGTGTWVSAYIVQLDNTTQDGSFFFLFEEGSS
jgi:hypothetical protein